MIRNSLTSHLLLFHWILGRWQEARSTYPHTSIQRTALVQKVRGAVPLSCSYVLTFTCEALPSVTSSAARSKKLAGTNPTESVFSDRTTHQDTCSSLLRTFKQNIQTVHCINKFVSYNQTEKTCYNRLANEHPEDVNHTTIQDIKLSLSMP